MSRPRTAAAAALAALALGACAAPAAAPAFRTAEPAPGPLTSAEIAGLSTGQAAAWLSLARALEDLPAGDRQDACAAMVGMPDYAWQEYDDTTNDSVQMTRAQFERWVGIYCG